MPTPALHVGFHQLNSDTSLNFQLNRMARLQRRSAAAGHPGAWQRILTDYPACIVTFLSTLLHARWPSGAGSMPLI